VVARVISLYSYMVITSLIFLLLSNSITLRRGIIILLEYICNRIVQWRHNPNNPKSYSEQSYGFRTRRGWKFRS